MPPVIVPAGNIADLKFKPLLAPDAVYTSGSVLSPFTNAMKFPAKAPFAGNVKFTLPPPTVYVATFRQLLPLCEYGQNFELPPHCRNASAIPVTRKRAVWRNI